MGKGMYSREAGKARDHELREDSFALSLQRSEPAALLPAGTLRRVQLNVGAKVARHPQPQVLDAARRGVGKCLVRFVGRGLAPVRRCRRRHAACQTRNLFLERAGARP